MTNIPSNDAPPQIRPAIDELLRMLKECPDDAAKRYLLYDFTTRLVNAAVKKFAMQMMEDILDTREQ
jgi:hypothetical protein